MAQLNPDTTGGQQLPVQPQVSQGENPVGARVPGNLDRREQIPQVPISTTQASEGRPIPRPQISQEIPPSSIETPNQISQEFTPNQKLPKPNRNPAGGPVGQTVLPQTPENQQIRPQGGLDYSQDANSTPASGSTPELLAKFLPKEPNGQIAFRTVQALKALKNSQNSASNHLS